MAGPKVFGKTDDGQAFSEWQQQDAGLPIHSVIQCYEDGMAGAYGEPEVQAEMRDWIRVSGGDPSGASVASSAGIVGTSEGKLSIPYVLTVDALGGNPWPGAAQVRGDCTVHGTKNGGLVTYGVEVALGEPDAVTGHVEQFPDIPEQGIAEGAFSPETLWWIHIQQVGNSDGWSCVAAAMALCKHIGLWPRAPFPQFNVDLTSYNYGTTTKYGRSFPPGLLDLGKTHLCRTMTELDGWEQIADFLDNGYGVNSCGGQAWSGQRDENGFSPTKSGGWSHSEAYIGADRRPWVAKKYGCPALLLQMNSWGPWNSGPRDIYDSAQFVPAEKRERWIKIGLVNPQTGNILIPHGARWVKCTTADSRYAVAFAGQSGWKRRGLVSLGAGGVV